jgi:glycosyltransferase involved in cell wall biosynthesis
LVYAKNGHRRQLLEHLAELYPRHIQIHDGRYRREESFEAARRSRACAYLADDDHGPLALQEILLAGCPTVGVRTGASFVRDGVTGYVVDRLPPDGQCIVNDDDAECLHSYLESINQAAMLDRQGLCLQAKADFAISSVVDRLIATLDKQQRLVLG